MSQAERAPDRWRVAITGSGGLIGGALARSLEGEGHEVVRLVRGAPRAAGEVRWDPEGGTVDTAGLEGVTAVVHLAGESLSERWTAERRRRIRESRVQGTRLLAEALTTLEVPPAVLVSASAIGYYGDRGDERLDEESAPGTGFLAEVAQEWEAAAGPAGAAGIRVVNPRLGVVFTPEGGALQRLLLPFRSGVGGTLGDGRQWMSWISLEDAIAALRFLITRPALDGAVNLVAPEPFTNAELTRELGRVLHRPTVLPVPAVALRLLFGEMADAMLLASQRVLPTRLLEAGFRFRHPRLDGALEAMLHNRS